MRDIDIDIVFARFAFVFQIKFRCDDPLFLILVTAGKQS